MRKILVTSLLLIGLGSFSFITYAKPKADSDDGVTAAESPTEIKEKKEKKEKKGIASREYGFDGKDSRKKGKNGKSSRSAS